MRPFQSSSLSLIVGAPPVKFSPSVFSLEALLLGMLGRMNREVQPHRGWLAGPFVLRVLKTKLFLEVPAGPSLERGQGTVLCLRGSSFLGRRSPRGGGGAFTSGSAWSSLSPCVSCRASTRFLHGWSGRWPLNLVLHARWSVGHSRLTGPVARLQVDFFHYTCCFYYSHWLDQAGLFLMFQFLNFDP